MKFWRRRHSAFDMHAKSCIAFILSNNKANAMCINQKVAVIDEQRIIITKSISSKRNAIGY